MSSVRATPPSQPFPPQWSRTAAEMRHAGLSDESITHPILACRRRSRSMWLHFPHLELLFLFWAFEGAVTAQISALANAGCPRVFWLALAALVRMQPRLYFRGVIGALVAVDVVHAVVHAVVAVAAAVAGYFVSAFTVQEYRSFHPLPPLVRTSQH